MATIRQKRALENISSGKYKSYKEAMIKAGYAESCAKKPNQKLIDSKGFQELEKAEKQQADQYYPPLDVRNKMKIRLAKLYEKAESGELDEKTQLMLIKVTNEVAKDHPDWFDEKHLGLDESLNILKELRRRQEGKT